MLNFPENDPSAVAFPIVVGQLLFGGLVGIGFALNNYRHYYKNQNNVCFLAERGYLDRLKELAKKGIHLDTQDTHGRTPLLCAIRTNQYKIIQYLIENGARIDTLDLNVQKYLLLLAQENDDLQTVKRLLKQNPPYEPLVESDSVDLELEGWHIQKTISPEFNTLVQSALEENSFELKETLYQDTPLQNVLVDMVTRYESPPVPTLVKKPPEGCLGRIKRGLGF